MYNCLVYASIYTSPTWRSLILVILLRNSIVLLLSHFSKIAAELFANLR
jgi:hypothetical protein